MKGHTIVNRWNWLGRVMLDHNLSSRSKEVAYWLVVHMNSATGLAHPSRQTLADLMSCSIRTVDDALTGLRREGWITKVGGGTGQRKTRQWAIEIKHARDIAADQYKHWAAKSVLGESTRADSREQHAQNFDTTHAEYHNKHARESAHEPYLNNSLKEPTSSEPSDDAVRFANQFVDLRRGLFPEAKERDFDNIVKEAGQLLDHADQKTQGRLTRDELFDLVFEALSFQITVIANSGQPAVSSPKFCIGNVDSACTHWNAVNADHK